MKNLSDISKLFIKVMGLQKWCLIHKTEKWGGGGGGMARENSGKCKSGPRAKRVGHHWFKVLRWFFNGFNKVLTVLILLISYSWTLENPLLNAKNIKLLKLL